MSRASLVALLLLAPLTTAQTNSTLCQASEEVITAEISERKLLGCGEGFSENLLWHLDRADSVSDELDGRVTRTATGRGAVIYLVDSGTMAGHDELTRAGGSVVIGSIDYDIPGACPPTAPCWDPANPMTMLFVGHGTGTAAMIAGRNTGVAPDASIVAVMHSGNYLRMFQKIIAHAWDPATPFFRTAIINLSGGLPGGDPKNPELDALLRRMTTGVDADGEADPDGKRFLFVVSGGNTHPVPEYSQCDAQGNVRFYPALLGTSVDGIVVVGGIDREDRYWDGACRGGVEVAAPATDLFLASIGAMDSYRYKPSGSNSGTSWAAPYVSGIAALLLERGPNASPTELEAQLKASPSIVDGLPVPLLPPPTSRRRAVRP